MRRYYFDAGENGFRKFDGQGALFTSDNAARDKAAAQLAALARRAILQATDLDYMIEVRNDDGFVCRLGFACRSRGR